MSVSRRAVLGAAAGTAALGIGGARATLAPSVSKSDFAAAVRAMRGVVGDAWVFADPDSVAPYRKSYVPDPRHAHVPVGAVAPQSVEEVQALLRIAAQYRQPVWPVSTGKNMGYGMTTCATPGQMVLDLKRMNHILAVDADSAPRCSNPASPTSSFRTISPITISRCGSMCPPSGRSRRRWATRSIAALAIHPTAIT